MNISNLSIAYSPRSPILEEVLKSAMHTLQEVNPGVFKQAISRQITWHSLSVDDKTLSSPSNVSSVRSRPTVINVRAVNDLIKVIPYDKSADLETLYAEEEVIRSIICAIEFNDSLAG